MICDCGHSDDRAYMTVLFGLLCSSCNAARRCPGNGGSDHPPARRSKGELDEELREAYKCLRQKLPKEWSDDRLLKIARRMVRHNFKRRSAYV